MLKKEPVDRRLRDAVLAVSGCLNTQMFGPGIYPAVPDDAPLPAPGAEQHAARDERTQRGDLVFLLLLRIGEF